MIWYLHQFPFINYGVATNNSVLINSIKVWSRSGSISYQFYRNYRSKYNLNSETDIYVNKNIDIFTWKKTMKLVGGNVPGGCARTTIGGSCSLINRVCLQVPGPRDRLRGPRKGLVAGSSIVCVWTPRTEQDWLRIKVGWCDSTRKKSLKDSNNLFISD